MINTLDRKSKNHLLSLPFVVGIGHGLKESGGSQTTDEAIMVLVRKKVAPESLASHQMVPKLVEGIRTDVIEVGSLVAHEARKDEVGKMDGTNEIQQTRTFHVRPAPPGVSIGHFRITAGTFGSVVYDKATGQPLILSNNHVIANASNGRDFRAQIGDTILQPGPMDGGLNNANIIAKLNRFIPLSDRGGNLVDCATARPLSSEQIIPAILEIDVVRGICSPELGMTVKKSGRTTGLTYGQVRAISVIVNVSYGIRRVLQFENQILTTSISAPGDSGSLVLSSDGMAVGLLFAGSDTSTIINPIQIVLEQLNVRF